MGSFNFTEVVSVIPVADSTSNLTFTDVIGNKSDAANNTADQSSIIGLLRYIEGTGGGIGAVLAILGTPAGADMSTDIAAISTLIGTPSVDVSTDIASILTVLGTPAGADFSADIAAISTLIGTPAVDLVTDINALIGAPVTSVMVDLTALIGTPSVDLATDIAAIPLLIGTPAVDLVTDINTLIGVPSVDLASDIAAIVTLLGTPAGADMSTDILTANTNIGDASGHTLTSLVAKIGDNATSLTALIGAPSVSLAGDIATIVGLLGTPVGADFSADIAAVDTKATSIQTDLGNPSARTNFKSIETMIGIPDAANSCLDDIVRTGFNSSSITANADGSILERLEYIQNSFIPDLGGLSFRGTCDTGMPASTTAIVVAGLAGYGNDYFNTKYYLQVIKNTNSVGNAPEREVRQITDYDTTSGTFTCTAFSVNVEGDDEIIVIHESICVLGRNDNDNTFDSSTVVANASGSILERLQYNQANVGNPSARANLQSIEAMLGNPDAAGKTIYDNLGDFVGRTNAKSLLLALGVPDVAGTTVYDNMGDAMARTNNKSLLAVLGAPDAAGKTIYDNLGDAVARTNNKSILAVLGVPDAAGKTIYDNLGDFVGRTNNKSILAVLGVPDVAGKDFYTCLITDRLDSATFGLSALNTDLDNILLETNQIGTVVNTGGAATLGAILGDFNNKTLYDLISDLASENSSDEAAGTYSYLDAGGEQDVITIATSNRKIIQGIWLDLTTMTQNGTIRAYYKVDGTNYKLMNVGGTVKSWAFTVADAADAVYLDLNIGISADFKVTYQEGGDEGTDRAIPYMIVYEVKG